MPDNRTKGKYYEDIAAMFLKQSGYNILCRNYTLKTGEIDIIAAKNNMLVFAEIKYRSSDTYGRPAEAVDYKKQQKIIKTAEVFISRNEERIYKIFGVFPYISFDIIEICEEQVNHIKGAFYS